MKLIYKNPNITVIKRNLKNIKVERHKVQYLQRVLPPTPWNKPLPLPTHLVTVSSTSVPLSPLPLLESWRIHSNACAAPDSHAVGSDGGHCLWHMKWWWWLSSLPTEEISRRVGLRLSLPPCDGTEIGQPSGKQKQVLTKPQSCQHLDLGLSSHQNER